MTGAAPQSLPAYRPSLVARLLESVRALWRPVPRPAAVKRRLVVEMVRPYVGTHRSVVWTAEDPAALAVATLARTGAALVLVYEEGADVGGEPVALARR